MHSRILIAIFLLLLWLPSCGKKGGLYLPVEESSAPVASQSIAAQRVEIL